MLISLVKIMANGIYGWQQRCSGAIGTESVTASANVALGNSDTNSKHTQLQQHHNANAVSTLMNIKASNV